MSIRKGVLLATAAAALISSALYQTIQATPQSKPVKCFGINSCRGRGACGSKTRNACQGQNACKGQSWLYVRSEKICKDRGGEKITKY